ncbi:PRC-barrel domain containing protein [Streptomyces sp. NPDC016845]|uniref:PRC-barrel domain containing protein n=1 Tax=Streptomyces sp. NPDC016845 TaxID=3364972 RepID=UPI0037AC721C
MTDRVVHPYDPTPAHTTAAPLTRPEPTAAPLTRPEPTGSGLTHADLLGYAVEADDGSAGTVDAHSEEVAPNHLVVDTGGPLLSKKVLLPRWAIARVDEANRTLHVARPRDLVKAAPLFDRDMRVTDPGYRARIDEHYRQEQRQH